MFTRKIWSELMNRPAGWHLLVLVAVVLALRLAVSQSRTPTPAVDQKPGIAQRPLLPAWEGPPMQIEREERARAGRQRDDNALGMKFCWCPPGTFRMGRASAFLDEDLGDGPVKVTLTQGFWMGAFEVTQAQWRSVMGMTLREQRARDSSQPRPVGDGTTRDHVGEGPDYPIYYTSHSDAEEFCRKLTETERSKGRIERNWEYRLPTEAQWEFACRAGITTATSFGDRLSSTQANFDGTKPVHGAPAGPYLHETTPIGQYAPNGWGLHDMHGNVSEWCRDCYTALPGGTDPYVEPLSSRRVFRGGCWYDPGAYCLSTTRSWGKVDGRGSGRGFRVALVPPGR